MALGTSIRYDGKVLHVVIGQSSLFRVLGSSAAFLPLNNKVWFVCPFVPEVTDWYCRNLPEAVVIGSPRSFSRTNQVCRFEAWYRLWGYVDLIPKQMSRVLPRAAVRSEEGFRILKHRFILLYGSCSSLVAARVNVIVQSSSSKVVTR